MDSKQSDRRRFLKDSAALAGVAMGAMGAASAQTKEAEVPKEEKSGVIGRASPEDSRPYGQPSLFENSLRIPEGGKWRDHRGDAATLTPLQDLVGIITPSALHFDTAKGFSPPKIDPRQFRLLIHGMVDRPLIFSLEDLKLLPSVSRVYFLECGGNTGEGRGQATAQLACGKTSCSEWTGVEMSVLLREAGVQVQKGASWIVAEGSEPAKHARSIPLEKAMQNVLVAYGQNGEAVRPENGYPLRLIVPGWLGNINIKWLRRIKVVDQPYMTKWESTGYARVRPDGTIRWFYFEMGPKSIITFPSGGQPLRGPGLYEVSGLAWSGGGAVRSVGISTDGGRTWKDAQLQEPIHRFAHTRFRFPWNWNGKEVVLQSRCTDELGRVQPSLVELSKLWGVSVEFWRSDPAPPAFLPVENFNPIQPWRVTSEGSVENALLS